MATTIYTYFHNDDLNGSRMVSMDDCMCVLYNILRNDNSFVKEFNETLKKPALYILLNRQTRKAYIGETDDFVKRIAQHQIKKSFWKEVLVFLGSNEDILSKTEVQYLEYLAYNKAKENKNYNLDENNQTPKLPHMNVMLKGKTEKFFVYVQLFAKFIDCDIFSTPIKQFKIHTTQVAKTNNDNIYNVSLSEQLKGRVKLSLNGKGEYTKAVFVHVVIKEYLKNHPSTTYDVLNQIFSQNLLGSWNHWPLLQKDMEFANNAKKRYVLGNGSVLQTADGVRFVVSSQWDYNNLCNVLEIIKALKMTYQILK